MDLLITLQFLVALAMGLVGSYFDNARHDFEVPNKVWVVFGIGGFIVAGFRWTWSPIFVLVHLIFAGIISGGVLLAYWLSKGAIGGADVKAVMSLGVTVGLWSFICVVVAVGSLTLYTVSIGGYRRTPFKEIMKMKAPFLPFLTFGIIGGFVAFLV